MSRVDLQLQVPVIGWLSGGSPRRQLLEVSRRSESERDHGYRKRLESLQGRALSWRAALGHCRAPIGLAELPTVRAARQAIGPVRRSAESVEDECASQERLPRGAVPLDFAAGTGDDDALNTYHDGVDNSAGEVTASSLDVHKRDIEFRRDAGRGTAPERAVT